MTDSLVTVLAAAATYDLTDLATVKDELGITGTADDGRLTRWISGASARIARACNRVFPEEGLSELFRRVHRHHAWTHLDGELAPLRLSRRPVTVLAGIDVDGSALSTSDWELDARTGEVWRLTNDRRTHWHGSKITVTYSAGYYPLPNDLREAALTLIRHRWAMGTRDPLMRSFSIDGVGAESYWVPAGGGPGELPPDLQPIADVIAAYRRPVFA
jgi:Phage gp6-like head-tail connector protein